MQRLERFIKKIKFTDVPQFKEGIPTSAIAKHPSIKPSGTARKSVTQPTSIMQPTLQAGACRFVTKAIELLGQLYPARFFFGQTKKKSPKASEATNVRTKRLK